MKLIALTSFHQAIVILQRCTHSMPMKKVKVKKWWSKWAYGWNFMGYLLAIGDFLKAFNLQKFHFFFLPLKWNCGNDSVQLYYFPFQFQCNKAKNKSKLSKYIYCGAIPFISIIDNFQWVIPIYLGKVSAIYKVVPDRVVFTPIRQKKWEWSDEHIWATLGRNWLLVINL